LPEHTSYPISTAPDAPPRATDPLAEEVLLAMRRILRRMAIHSKQLHRQSGLTLPQLLCLQAIARSPSGQRTSAELSRELKLSPATLTGIVDRLEREGLLRRERETADRRKVRLHLSEAGLRRIDGLPAPLQDQVMARLAKFSGAQREGLQQALRTLVDLLDAGDLEPEDLAAEVVSVLPPPGI